MDHDLAMCHWYLITIIHGSSDPFAMNMLITPYLSIALSR